MLQIDAQSSVLLSRSCHLILLPGHSWSTCEPMRHQVRESLGLPGMSLSVLSTAT